MRRACAAELPPGACLDTLLLWPPLPSCDCDPFSIVKVAEVPDGLALFSACELTILAFGDIREKRLCLLPETMPKWRPESSKSPLPPLTIAPSACC